MLQQSRYKSKRIPKELKAGSQRDVCTSMHVSALFTIAKKYKQH